jgi:Nitrate reductase delta subunit
MELFRALASLLEPPAAGHASVAAAAGLPPPPSPDEHADLILFQAYPYASVYLGDEGMLGGEARDRIAGFFRAVGAEPPAEPDHLGALFAALAELADEGNRDGADARRAAAALAARRALFWEHVASWMPPYLALLRRAAKGFYAAWADLAEAVLAAEAETLGPDRRLSLHLRAAAALPGGRGTGVEDLIALVLAPVRSGFVITRGDLLRGAAELGLGCRAGERRYALRSLLEQGPAAVIGWLAGEANRQSLAMARSPLGATAGWWSERASATAGWLEGLAADAARAADAAGAAAADAAPTSGAAGA